MTDNICDDLDTVEHNVTEQLIQHLQHKFHPYTLAALGTAIAAMNDRDDEEEVEDLLCRSCRIFFGFTLAFMSRAQKEDRDSLWKVSVDIGKEVYGYALAQHAAKLAIQDLEEFESICDEGAGVSSTQKFN